MARFKEVEVPKQVADATDQATKMVQQMVRLQPLDTTVQNAVAAGKAVSDYGVSIPQSLRLISMAKMAQSAANSPLFTAENRAVINKAAAELKSHADKALETSGKEAQLNQQIALGIVASLQQYMELSAAKKEGASYFAQAIRDFSSGHMKEGKASLEKGLQERVKVQDQLFIEARGSLIAQAGSVQNTAARLMGDRYHSLIVSGKSDAVAKDDPIYKDLKQMVTECNAYLANLRETKKPSQEQFQVHEMRMAAWSVATSCLGRAMESESYSQQAKASTKLSGSERGKAAAAFETNKQQFIAAAQMALFLAVPSEANPGGIESRQEVFRKKVQENLDGCFKQRADIISNQEGLKPDDPLRGSIRAITRNQLNATLSMATHARFDETLFQCAERNYSRILTGFMSVGDEKASNGINVAAASSFHFLRMVRAKEGDVSENSARYRKYEDLLENKIANELHKEQTYNILKNTANIAGGIIFPLYGLALAAHGIADQYMESGKVRGMDVFLFAAGAIPVAGIGVKIARAGKAAEALAEAGQVASRATKIGRAVQVGEAAIGYAGLTVGTTVGMSDALELYTQGRSVDAIIGAFSTLFPVGHMGARGAGALARRKVSERAVQEVTAGKPEFEAARARFYMEHRSEIWRAVPDMGGANLEERMMGLFLAKAKAKTPDKRTPAEARIIALEERNRQSAAPSEKAAISEPKTKTSAPAETSKPDSSALTGFIRDRETLTSQQDVYRKYCTNGAKVEENPSANKAKIESESARFSALVSTLNLGMGPGDSKAFREMAGIGGWLAYEKGKTGQMGTDFGDRSRFSLNLNSPEAARTFMELFSAEIRKSDTPIGMKTTADSELYGTRLDNTIIYARKEHAGPVMEILLKINVQHPELFNDASPALMKKIGKGIAAADESNAKRPIKDSKRTKQISFGEHRADAIFAGLEKARAAGIEDEAAIARSVRDAFVADGINPDKPYLNAGSRDIYTVQEMEPGKVNLLSRHAVRTNKTTDPISGQDILYLQRGKQKGKTTLKIDNETYSIVSEGGMKVIVDGNSVLMPKALKEGPSPKAAVEKPKVRGPQEEAEVSRSEPRAKPETIAPREIPTKPSQIAAPQELAGKIDQDAFHAFMEKRRLGPEAAEKAGKAYAEGGMPAFLRELGVKVQGPEWANLTQRMEGFSDILFSARDRQGNKVGLESILDAEHPGAKITAIELSKDGARGGAWRCEFTDASGQLRSVYMKIENMATDELSHDIHSARGFPTPGVRDFTFIRADGSPAHFGIMEAFAPGMRGSDARIGEYTFEHACPVIDVMGNPGIREAISTPAGLKEFGEELGRFLRFEHQTGAADFNQENVMVGIVRAEDGSTRFRVGRIDMGDVLSFHEKPKVLDSIMGGYIDSLQGAMATPERLDAFRADILEGWVAEGQEFHADVGAMVKIQSAVAAHEESGTMVGHVQKRPLNAEEAIRGLGAVMESSRPKLEGDFEAALPAKLWDDEKKSMERRAQRKQQQRKAM
jgi:hypothetical protein